jgi:hypothetical protein
MMISPKESWRQMNRTSEGNKKEREAAEQVTRQLYSGSRNEPVSVSIPLHEKAESLMNETV